MSTETPNEWNGLPIKRYQSGQSLNCPDTIYKIAYDWDNEKAGEFTEQFPQYLADPKSAATIGLSLGLNGECADEFYEEAVTLLLQHKVQLPKLRWLFLGDMEMEESELTWIGQGDVGAPVLQSFPELEVLYARGGEGSMSFTPCSHPRLKKLVLQPGGMDKQFLRNLLASDFPALETLELWLGDDERGGDLTPDDVRDLLMGNPFPQLTTLGLCNSAIINGIARDIATAPILAQLQHLDLSMGTLQDDGALALLASDQIRNLQSLNLSHHYMTTPIMREFATLGIPVDVSQQEEPDDWDGEAHYYIAISE